MKKLIIATLIALTASQTASASSFFIDCTNSSGSLTNVSGHADETVIRYKNWQTGEYVTEEYQGAVMEVVLLRHEIDEKQTGGECGGVASWTRTYVVNGVIHLPEGASERAKEIAGRNQYFICESHVSNMMPPCDEN